MTALISGLIIILAVHSISIVSHTWRNQMVDRLGEIPWKGTYALIALLGFVLILWGYGLARRDPFMLYSPPASLPNIALLVLLPISPLLLST